MRQEIDDPRKYRVSMSGFSIKTGWGDERKIVAKYPGAVNPLDQQAYVSWLEDAERICEQHNTTLVNLGHMQEDAKCRCLNPVLDCHDAENCIVARRFK